MENAIIEVVVNVLAKLAITLIGIFGAWLLQKMAETQKLNNIGKATELLIQAAEATVLELQQTTVEGWKAANADGKLTDFEIKELGVLLLDKTLAKLNEPTVELLKAAGMDIEAMIHGAAEALIARLKEHKQAREG